MTKFTMFLSDDAGAVTIDWVALTAGILLLGILVVYSIFNNGVSSLVSKINSTLQGVSIIIPSASISGI
jgi:Flp pilus assembly pilin Flp